MSMLKAKYDPRLDGEIGDRHSTYILGEADLPNRIFEEAIFNAEQDLKSIIAQRPNIRAVGACVAVDLA